ncbi:F0F1 ATP synthase subunit A [Candidatus Woesebacteria bacterium]|nr:F0F1 ATP synthase subunit A [Candidatus Woesebacteria bacterium]
MSASGLHISISAEKLFSVGNLVITNSMFTSMVVSAILITFALITHSQLKKTDKPTGLQNFAEFIIEALHGLVHGVTGDLKKTRLFLPVIASFFLWILLNNWLGLVPGVGTIRMIEKSETETIQIAPETTEEHSGIVESVHASEPVITDEHAETNEATTTEKVAPTAETEHAVASEESHGPKYIPILRPGTADLNTTMALAIVSILITQVFGVKYLKLGYFKKFINFSNPIMTFVGFLELISEFAKIISFAFRLFGNIFAGEVLLVVMAFLLPVVVPMPFYGLELFVGFIQALVFSMLSLVFFNMATQSHDAEH